MPVIMPTPLTLDEVQQVILQHAPTPYYVRHYVEFERNYLPALIEHIDGWAPWMVADVGPGYGTMAVWLASRGWDVVVFDKMPLGHSMTQELCDLYGIEYVQHDIEFEPLPSDFSLVTMTQVIPHLRWRPDTAVQHAAAGLSGDVRCCPDAHDDTFLCTCNRRGGLVGKNPPRYARWQDVPVARGGMPHEDMVTALYDRFDLAALIHTAFHEGSTWSPPDTGPIFAEGHCRKGAKGYAQGM